MTHTAVFKGEVEKVGVVPPVATRKEIQEEPMLFSASWIFAREMGGPLTREIMDASMGAIFNSVPQPDYKHLVIDTRSHMLNEGMYPAIPGWHCDCAPRHGYTGQPQPDRATSDQLNFTCLVTSAERGGSKTKFLIGEHELEYQPLWVWGSINEVIEDDPLLAADMVVRPWGEITRFTGRTLHRAQSSKEPGWRWRFFFRASFMTRPPINEIRKQVQVYAPASKGW